MEYDDVIKLKYFPRYWSFVWGIHRSPVKFPHKGQWREALIFCLVYAWINGWVNNREAGDFRCHHTHYDVTVMGIASAGYSCTHPWTWITVTWLTWKQPFSPERQQCGSCPNVSISDKMSRCKIPWSLEAARFVFKIVRSLWNLTGTSAALLSKCLSNFKAMRWFKLPISRLRDFMWSYDKTSYRI